jgi:hypothetical protein
MLRSGHSRSVVLHVGSRRRSYGSIPHGSSPHRNRFPQLSPNALPGTRAVRPFWALVAAPRGQLCTQDTRHEPS